MSDTITQFLTFNLGEELYAIDIMQVQEVLEQKKITKIPGSFDFVKGVINVRGHMVPVIDLRYKLTEQNITEGLESRCIIIELKTGAEIINLGILVDSVKEVFEVSEETIELPPKLGMSINTKFIKGITRVDDNFIIILNIQKVLNEKEIAEIEDVSVSPPEHDEEEIEVE